MRLEKITNRSQLKTGLRVRFICDGTPVNDAKLFMDRHVVYACQNELCGTDCGRQNRQGYCYSFSFCKDDFVGDQGALNYVLGVRAMPKEGETL